MTIFAFFMLVQVKPFVRRAENPFVQQTIEQMTDSVLALGTGQKIMVMAPVVDGRKGTHQSFWKAC